MTSQIEDLYLASSLGDYIIVLVEDQHPDCVSIEKKIARSAPDYVFRDRFVTNCNCAITVVKRHFLYLLTKK